MPLQTRNVFIDTQSFVKAGLEFTSRTLQSFADTCYDGELNHITTSVVVREVKDKISEHIKESLQGVNAFRRKAKILSKSESPAISGLFVDIDAEKVERDALEVFEGFLDDAKSTVLDLKGVNADDVFTLYFDRKPPFQEGKKKSEFPDAFSLLALASHLGEQDQIYVVSEDSDLSAFCRANGRFIMIDSLSKVLDIFNMHDEQRAEFIKDYLDAEENNIKQEIKSKISEAEIYNSSTWENAKVEEFAVLEVNDFEPKIISIDDDGCEVSFDVCVKYRSKVTGPDFNNAIYDREEGRAYTFDDTSRIMEGELEFPVELDVEFELQDGKFDVRGMEISVLDLSSGIEVSVEENQDLY